MGGVSKSVRSILFVGMNRAGVRIEENKHLDVGAAFRVTRVILARE
jgi:hypothetical protein